MVSITSSFYASIPKLIKKGERDKKTFNFTKPHEIYNAFLDMNNFYISETPPTSSDDKNLTRSRRTVQYFTYLIQHTHDKEEAFKLFTQSIIEQLNKRNHQVNAYKNKQKFSLNPSKSLEITARHYMSLFCIFNRYMAYGYETSSKKRLGQELEETLMNSTAWLKIQKIYENVVEERAKKYIAFSEKRRPISGNVTADHRPIFTKNVAPKQHQKVPSYSSHFFLDYGSACLEHYQFHPVLFQHESEKYGFGSNFSNHSIKSNAQAYTTSENYFQAQKVISQHGNRLTAQQKYDFNRIATVSPMQSKVLVNQKKYLWSRSNKSVINNSTYPSPHDLCNSFPKNISDDQRAMWKALILKFTQHPNLLEEISEQGSRYWEENTIFTHYQGRDGMWGNDYNDKHNPIAKNTLGRMLALLPRALMNQSDYQKVMTLQLTKAAPFPKDTEYEFSFDFKSKTIGGSSTTNSTTSSNIHRPKISPKISYNSSHTWIDNKQGFTYATELNIKKAFGVSAAHTVKLAMTKRDNYTLLFDNKKTAEEFLKILKVKKLVGANENIIDASKDPYFSKKLTSSTLYRFVIKPIKFDDFMKLLNPKGSFIKNLKDQLKKNK
jgi:predicted NAD-dependent protein-ADP-ribosyltransferase YbiA (DUF1768 family)